MANARLLRVSTKNGLQKLMSAAGIFLLHLPPLTLPFIESSLKDWIAFCVFYLLVLFALGVGLHRYFAHRAFKTSRAIQFALALLGGACFGDPVGFAGRHRLHHRYSDTERDYHGPRHGLWFAWFGHMLEDGYEEQAILAAARDLAKYPELLWLHRNSHLTGTATVALVFLIGGYSAFAVWCLAWCLVAIHGSFAVNYFCHLGGRRRYETGDNSSNSLLVSIMLLGEGWHNNHHRYPGAARAGFFWYEFDGLYYALKILAWTGLVWDLREVPEAVKFGGNAAVVGPPD
jgi:stearoyl-CoA desaturase (delta-9 desaturase)